MNTITDTNRSSTLYDIASVTANMNKNATTNQPKNGSPIRPGTENMESTNAPSTITQANTTETEAPSSKKVPPPSTTGGKKTALAKLSERNKIAGQNPVIDKMTRMELFDSTKASSIETKGTSSLKSIAPAQDGKMISGRNEGAEQNEPD